MVESAKSAWSVRKRTTRSTVWTRYHIRAKAFYVHNSRHVAAKLLKHTRNVSLLSERRIPRTGYHCIIMAAGVRAIFGPCRQVAGLVPRLRDGMSASSRPLAARAQIHAEAACACTWNGNDNLERSHECLVSRGSHLRTACGSVCDRDQNWIKRSKGYFRQIKRS